MRRPTLPARMRCLLDGWRRRFALAVCPEIDIAHGKRRLEQVAREAGASWAMSKRIASNYFEDLRDG